MTVYYTSQSRGVDLNNNSGTDANPFKTIQKGVNFLSSPGDRLKIETGSYYEVVSVANKHGADGNPIVIEARDGHTVEIDGREGEVSKNSGLPGGKAGNTVPQIGADGKTNYGVLGGRYHTWNGLLDINGSSYIELNNIIVKKSMGRGVRFFGDSHHIVANNVSVLRARSNPVVFQNCTYVTYTGGRWTEGGYYFPRARPTADGNWSGTTCQDAHHIHVSKIQVDHNWCEPFIADANFGGSTNVLFENSVVFNNWKPVLMQAAEDVTVRNNFFFESVPHPLAGVGHEPFGIVIGNPEQDGWPESWRFNVTGNILVNLGNAAIKGNAGWDRNWDPSDILSDCDISNNTIIRCGHGLIDTVHYSFNCFFTNNIVVDVDNYQAWAKNNPSAWTFGPNFWSKPMTGIYHHPNDKVGDPQLANISHNPTPNNWDAMNFMVRPGGNATGFGASWPSNPFEYDPDLPPVDPPPEPPPPVVQGTFWVSKSRGNDQSSGTEGSPFATISKGVSLLGPGSTLIIENGVYNEVVVIKNKLGTEANPIKIQARSGHNNVIIDGLAGIVSQNSGLPNGTVAFTIPYGYSGLSGTNWVWEGLLDIESSSYVTVDNITVRGSRGRGLRIFGYSNQITLNNVNLEDNRANSILIQDATNVVVDGGRWTNGGCYFPVIRPSGAGPAPAPVAQNVDNLTIQNVTIDHHWSESFVADANFGGTTNVTFTKNIVHNNWKPLFFQSLSNLTCTKNFIFNDPTHPLVTDPLDIESGILLSSPRQTTWPISYNFLIDNNIIFGIGKAGIEIDSDVTPNNGLDLCVISNNTILNCHFGILEQGNNDLSNLSLIDNIIVGSTVVEAFAFTPSAWTFGPNFWSVNPGAPFSNAGDLLGDPELVDSTYVPTSSSFDDVLSFMVAPNGNAEGFGADWLLGEPPPPPPPPPPEEIANFVVSQSRGDDNNDGTDETPFATITKGVSMLGAGDTLWIEDGDYYEVVSLYQLTGTYDEPITVMARPGHTSVFINGKAGEVSQNSGLPGGSAVLTVPAGYGALTGNYFVNAGMFDIRNCAYVNVIGITVKNSMGRGIRVFEPCDNILIEDVILDSNRGTNILIEDTSDITIRGGRWTNGGCYFPQSRPQSDGNPQPVTLNNATNIEIDGVEIDHNWAGALQVDANNGSSNNVLFHNNICHNNYSPLTVQSAQDITIEYNLFFNDAPHGLGLSSSSAGMYLIQANNDAWPAASNYVVRHNIFANIDARAIWVLSGSAANNGLDGCLIEYNTIIGCDTGLFEGANNLSNATFANNIITQCTTDISCGHLSSWTFGPNAFDSDPGSNYNHVSDVYGDPELVDDTHDPTAESYDPYLFMVSDGSPATGFGALWDLPVIPVVPLVMVVDWARFAEVGETVVIDASASEGPTSYNIRVAHKDDVPFGATYIDSENTTNLFEVDTATADYFISRDGNYVIQVTISNSDGVEVLFDDNAIVVFPRDTDSTDSPKVYAYILNHNLDLVKIIDDYKSFIWAEAYNKVSTFELDLPYTYIEEDNLEHGFYIVRSKSDKVMIIQEKKPYINETESGLLVTGESAEYLLKLRSLSRSYPTFGTSAETSMYNFVIGEMVTPDDPNRKIDILSGTVYKDTLTNYFEGELGIQSVYDVCVAIATFSGLGFKVVRTDDNKLAFTVYEGANRTGPDGTNPTLPPPTAPYVAFSPNYENARSLGLYQKDGGDNVTLVRVITDDLVYPDVDVWVGMSYTTPTQEPSGLERIEVVTTLSINRNEDPENPLTDAETLAIILQKGAELLQEKSAVNMFEGEFYNSGVFKYGEDFFLGDVVVIPYVGEIINARLVEVVDSYSAEGHTVRMTFDFSVRSFGWSNV